MRKFTLVLLTWQATRRRIILNFVNAPGLGVDLYRPGMLLDDDVMVDQAR
jgi:hypothetical protein